jgi:hypothetical protein
MAGCPNTGFFGGDFGGVGVAVEVAEEGGEAFDHGAVGIAEEDGEAGDGVDGFFDPDAGDAAGDAAVGGLEGVGEGMAGAAADEFGEALLGVGEEVEVFDEGVLFGGEGHGQGNLVLSSRRRKGEMDCDGEASFWQGGLV